MTHSMKLAHVKWKDANSHDNAWMNISDADSGLSVVESVGWVLVNNKERIVLLPAIDVEGEQCFGAITIPKSWIIKITDLKVPNE